MPPTHKKADYRLPPWCKFKQTVRKLNGMVSTAARRVKFRDFFCSARPQAAKFGLRLTRRGVSARSARFLHRDLPSMASMGYAVQKSGAKCPLPAQT